MGCDICKKPGETRSVNSILKLGNEVQDICGQCESVANKLLEKYRNMAWVRAGRKLKAMKKRYDSKGGSE